MVTLKDVAAQAGVSVSTVSLVLNQRDSGRITPEVAERVRRVARELGYVPNLLARGLRTKQTRTIGLLSDQVASTPFAGRMLAAAQREAWDAGYLLLLIDTADTPTLETPAISALLQRNVEALIYASMYHRVLSPPSVPPTIPLVVLDGRPAGHDDIDWIVPDEEEGARTAVASLIGAGHRRIAFCNYADVIPASIGRLAGYRAALHEAAIPVDESLITAAADSTAAEGRRAAAALLDRADRPTAIFCFSDRIAMGVYQAAAEHDIHIPHDLSIIGFDDQEFVADALRPGLTTMALPHDEMGAWAARRAIQRLEPPNTANPIDTRFELARCRLVERDSIRPPADGR